jgi:hypothetical protein
MKRTTPWVIAVILALALGVSTFARHHQTPATVTGAPLPHAPTATTGIPDHITLTWTDNPATTQTITWRTNTSVKSGLAQYAQGATIPDTAPQVVAEPHDLQTDLGEYRVFTAVLTKLSPKTTYSYKVGDGKTWSERHTFVTADPGAHSLKLLVFGDSQSGVAEPIYGPWATTVHNAFNANPDAQFVVNVGDLVELGASEAHWDAWFAAAQGIIDTIPEMAVEGNHETYSYFFGPTGSKPRLWSGQFALPQNGPEELKGQVYSFDCGPAHFVVLDSQQAEEQGQQGTMLQQQASWLERDLSASRATWKIAFFHKTPYDLKPSRHSPEVRTAFCPVFDKYHLDIAFCGHDHGVARTWPVNADRAVAKPSQGTVYYVAGRSGRKTYDDLLSKPLHAFFLNPQREPVYLVVEIADQRLTVKTCGQGGSLIDEFFIDKKQDADSDSTRLPESPVVWSD